MINEYFSLDQLNEAAIEYFQGDSLASSVWINKYAIKEKGKYIEKSPEETLKRIVDEIERKEKEYPNPLTREEIHENLKGFGNFIFAGSILFGLGNKHQISSLGNCFFVDNGADSYGGIFNTDETMAQLMKRRGGVGITLEALRPTSSLVNNSAQSSTGSISFAHRYSNTTREVAQDGRRGALMISCFTPDTFVKTDKGWEYITKTIERWKNGEKPFAWTHDGFKEIKDVQEFPETEVYEVKCENGKIIKVTGDHKFVVRNIITNEEYLKELKFIDIENEEMVFFGVHEDDIYNKST
jgi:ribonucleotide reductase alpha subunit